MEVYVSKHYMFDTTEGWKLSDTEGVFINIDDALLHALFTGEYHEQFAVHVYTYSASVLRKLKRWAKVGEDVYFGFYIEEEKKAFQVQMLFEQYGRRKKYEIPAQLTFAINGFPQIFQIASYEIA